MNKKKYVILVVAVISFGLLLVGGTYAWLISNDVTVNGSSNGVTTNFYAVYDFTNDDGSISETAITGTLMQTSYPKGGLHGKISMRHSETSGTDAIGSILMTVGSGTASKLYSSVAAHCERATTLESLKVYEDESSCTSAGNIWVAGGSALKYAVYKDSVSTPVSVGYVDGVKTITIRDNFVLGADPDHPQIYYLYIWLDGELADSSYASLTFSGNIHLKADQVEIAYGDVNLDGEINTMDRNLFMNHLENNIFTGQTLLNADCNADGVVDEIDADIVDSYISHKSGYEELDEGPVYIYDVFEAASEE